MTIIPAAMPRTFVGRLRWAVADGWTITLRSLAHWKQQPAQFLITLMFPIMIALLFGYLFGGSMVVPGGGNYREFLMPGLFAMTMLFGVESTMIAVATDASRGVTDRFRSMPMASSAVVVGRAIADMVDALLVLVVLLGCGVAIGWRWREGIGDAALALGLLLLLRFAFIWIGIYLGLVVRNPESVMVVQIVVWPIGFLANTFSSPAGMPDWLGMVAEWNPLSSTVAATRQLFGNPGWGGDSWIAEHALLMAVVWPLLLTAVFLPLAVRRYRRLSL